jgi:hypothetical protein
VFTSIYLAINYHISFFEFWGYVDAVPGTRDTPIIDPSTPIRSKVPR